jgi:hypothetical protein
VKSLRPILAPESLIDDLETTAQLWNREMDKITEDLIYLVETSREIPYVVAIRKLSKINLKRQKIWRQYRSCSQSMEYHQRWNEVSDKASLQIAVDHEKWETLESHYHQR